MQQIPKSATRRTTRISATERFHASAGRSTGVQALVGAIAVAFLVVLGFVFLSPRNDKDIERYHVDKALQEARTLEDQGKLELARAKYEEALRLMIGDDWRTRVIETRAHIKDLRRREDDLKAAEAEWKALRDQAKACPPEKVRELFELASRMGDRHRRVPWEPELRQLVADLESRLTQGPPDPLKRRTEIVQERKLDGPKGAADWSGAIRDWKGYMALKISEEWRKSAQAEIPRLQPLAREDLDLIGKRAARMVEEGKRAEAVALLKSQRPRFELTESAPTLEKMIAQADR